MGRAGRCASRLVRLNALSGIGGVQTLVWGDAEQAGNLRLNALSGIGGVQTPVNYRYPIDEEHIVLMPCRALEAFRRGLLSELLPRRRIRLNALSGIGGVQTEYQYLVEYQYYDES